MSKESDIIAKMLSELRAIDSPPFGQRIAGTAFEFPSWINAGDGQSLNINRKISDLMADLGTCLYATEASLTLAISRSDWAGIVRRSLGPILGATDLDDPVDKSSEATLAALKNELDKSNWNYGKRTFLFGCSLVEGHEVSTFVVGPVTISSRSSWLNDALEEGRISRVTYRRLTAKWSGKQVRRRRLSLESANERDILDAIGNASYVCSVQTNGLFGEFAKEKALLAARLTLLGVGLMWNSPAKALKEINLAYDGPPYRQTYAFFQERPEIFGGSRWANSLHGVSLFGDKWDHLISERGDWWKTLSETIQFLLVGASNSERPELMKAFAHALIWFHEACREQMSMIATAKYMASLDALACGFGENGIMNLVSARVGVNPQDPVRDGGPSFKSAIKRLYGKGRSQLLHGNSERLGHDWQDQRELAESIARICLILCFHWAADHPDCDDPKQMAKA